MGLKVPDFGRSFIRWLTKDPSSFGRFEIDCLVYRSEELLAALATSVMAGNLYRDEGKPKQPPYRYQFAMIGDRYRIFRDYRDGWQDAAGQALDLFEELSPVLKSQELSRVDSALEIRGALLAGYRLQAKATQGELSLHFPIRHVNALEDEEKFQVETGPVLYPFHDEEPMSWPLACVFFNGFGSWEALEWIGESDRAHGRRFFSSLIEQEVRIEVFTDRA